MGLLTLAICFGLVACSASMSKAKASNGTITITRFTDFISGDSDKITITLDAGSFSSDIAGGNATDWFTNIPIGLKAVVDTVSGKSATIRFEGLSFDKVSAGKPMEITIPEKEGWTKQDCRISVITNEEAWFAVNEYAATAPPFLSDR